MDCSDRISAWCWHAILEPYSRTEKLEALKNLDNYDYQKTFQSCFYWQPAMAMQWIESK
jgi:hypothetical protein